MSISDIAGSASPAGRLRVERRARRPKIVPDRRRFKRVVVSLNGRFMSEDKREYPCEVLNMSPGGMALRAPLSPRVGERIVAYLDNLGRLEGTVARIFEGGFAVELKASAQKRERIANLLTWLTNRDLGGEERQCRALRAACSGPEADHAEQRRLRLPGDRRILERCIRGHSGKAAAGDCRHSRPSARHRGSPPRPGLRDSVR